MKLSAAVLGWYWAEIKISGPNNREGMVTPPSECLWTDARMLCFALLVSLVAELFCVLLLPDQYEKSLRRASTRRLRNLLPICVCCWKTATGSTGRTIPSRVKRSASKHYLNRNWLFFQGPHSVSFILTIYGSPLISCQTWLKIYEHLIVNCRTFGHFRIIALY